MRCNGGTGNLLKAWWNSTGTQIFPYLREKIEYGNCSGRCSVASLTIVPYGPARESHFKSLLYAVAQDEVIFYRY